MEFKHLFQSGKIGVLEVKNRIVFPAMGTQMPGDDGEVTTALINWYARRARGGAGLITVEIVSTATAIDPFRLSQHVMRIDDPKFIPGMARLAKAIHDNGAKAGIQLTPGAGAHVSGGPWFSNAQNLQPVTPSGIPPLGQFYQAYGVEKKEHPPRALSTGEVEKMEELSGAAAGYAKEAGFDLIEIHAHYGYLIAEFLSEYYNRRTDKYGGDFDKRCRFLIELLEAMRRAVGPSFPIVVKYSIDEYFEHGRTIKESQEIARKLEAAGADGITVSAGVSGSKMPANPPYFFPKGLWIHLGQAMKQTVKIPVILPGRLSDPQLAEQVLKDGKADFIAIGRGLIADPDWPQKVQKGEISEIRWCLSCNECRQTQVVKRLPIRCAVNAAAGREGQYDVIKPAEVKRKVVVVGGGPGGMEAARVAAIRGHDVTLFEQRKKLGGLMAVAGVHNEEIDRFTGYITGQIDKLPIKVKLQTEATASLIQELKPDAVILAIGGTFPAYNVPGIERANVLSSKDLYQLTNGTPVRRGFLLSTITTLGKQFVSTAMVRRFLGTNFPIGKKVAVIGGQFPGCSVSLALAKKGKKVTIIEESGRYGNDMEAHTMIAFSTQVENGNIKVLTSTRVKEITGKGLIISNGENCALLEADTVLLALDLEPTTSKLAEELKDKVKEVYTIGDAKSFHRIMVATAEGFETAFTL